MAIKQTFSTDHGKKVLEWLHKMTTESPTWSAGLAREAGMEAATAHGFAREGQNAMVRDLKERIALAEKCKTPDDLFDLMKGAPNGH